MQSMSRLSCTPGRRLDIAQTSSSRRRAKVRSATAQDFDHVRARRTDVGSPVDKRDVQPIRPTLLGSADHEAHEHHVLSSIQGPVGPKCVEVTLTVCAVSSMWMSGLSLQERQAARVFSGIVVQRLLLIARAHKVHRRLRKRRRRCWISAFNVCVDHSNTAKYLPTQALATTGAQHCAVPPSILSSCALREVCALALSRGAGQFHERDVETNDERQSQCTVPRPFD
ncbi:hypothetical protein C8Q80DRAFT_298821 [Daedaleopsis nitida]|nr:hypothetical protein C8Q80DRAFT_298821 [Daedaleopsis nitida]